MSRRHTNGVVEPLAEQFNMIANAGYAGVDIVYGDFSTDAIEPLLREHQLACTITAFPDSIQALRPAIDMAMALGARHVNIIGKVYPFGVDDGARYVNGWLDLCREAADGRELSDRWREALQINQMAEQIWRQTHVV